MELDIDFVGLSNIEEILRFISIDSKKLYFCGKERHNFLYSHYFISNLSDFLLFLDILSS